MGPFSVIEALVVIFESDEEVIEPETEEIDLDFESDGYGTSQHMSGKWHLR